MHDLTAAELRALLCYDPDTGVFTNRFSRGKAQAGSTPGYFRADGYQIIRLNYTQYLGHRLAWLYTHGKWPEKHIDHVDRNPANNSLANLRECDDAQNAQNLSPNGYGSSGYLGVTKGRRATWVAKIKVAQRTMYVGSYRCATAAYVAYCAEKRRLHTFVAAGAEN